MRLRYTRGALVDLRNIAEFIARDNLSASHRVVVDIRRTVQRLTENPTLGRPGRVEGTRELSVPRLPFIVAYRIAPDAVDVLAVVHAARMWPERF
jgi:addiction module RelE/StbE family toxin